MDKTVQDYLVNLRNEEISENEKKRNLEWTQDFVSMALSNIGSQVMKTIFSCSTCTFFQMNNEE
jgi:hypothetical protein